MRRRSRLWRRIVLAVCLFALAAMATDGRGEGVCRHRCRSTASYPAVNTAYAPVLGKAPYYGQALGATYFRWGYFGARENCQLSDHKPYYGESVQFGYSKGY